MKSSSLAVFTVILMTATSAANADKAGAEPEAMQLGLSQVQLVPSVGESQRSVQSLVPAIGDSQQPSQSQLVPAIGGSQTPQSFQLVPSVEESMSQALNVPAINPYQAPSPYSYQPPYIPSFPSFQYPAQPNMYPNVIQYVDYSYEDTPAQPPRSSNTALLLFALFTLLNSQTTTTATSTTTVAPISTTSSTTIATTTPPFFGWISHNNCRYLVYRTPLTHNAAETYCSGLGARLAITNMKTQTDRAFLAAAIGLQQSEYAWFGLEDADGSAGTAAIFIDGSSYTPDSAGDDYVATSTPTCGLYAPAHTASKVIFNDCGTPTLNSICEVCP